MPLMTKKGLRVLMYEAIVDGDVVDMPWDYEMHFDYDRSVFHMHSTDSMNPNDFDATKDEIIDLYEDLWIGVERNYRYAIDFAVSENGYLTLDWVEFKYDPDSKTLFADDLHTITPIHDLDEFKRFMEG